MSCKPYDKCFDFVELKKEKVSFTDKNSKTKYIYENSAADTLSMYEVDGCLIKDNGCKCDFLLLNCTKKISYFIELKGSDLMRAIEQIERSIDVLHKDFKDYSVEARIVLTRVNTTDLKSIKLIKFENKLKKLNGKLLKQTRELVEKN